MNQQPITAHPLVARYLDELTRLLHAVDPVERTEVVDGVREHLEASLHGTSWSDEDVRAALAEIGSPQAVADEAYAGRAPAPQTFPQPVPAMSRRWVPVVVMILEVLALLIVIAVIGSSASVVESSSSTTSAAGVTETTDVQTTFTGTAGSGIAAIIASLPFLVAIVVLVMLSTLWVGREKAVLIGLAPAAALVFAVLPEVGYALLGVGGVYAGTWAALGLTVVGGAAVVTVLVRRGNRRADRLAAT